MRGSVRRHLFRMERLGVVRLSGGRWERMNDDSALELAALLLGVLGEDERELERHRAEQLARRRSDDGRLLKEADQTRRSSPASPREASCLPRLRSVVRGQTRERPVL